MADYTRFRGDLWVTQFNFEHTSALISDANNELNMVGTFRTKSDLAALIWRTDDIIKHNYCRYKYDDDYTNVVLRFKAKFDGYVCRFNNLSHKPSLAFTMYDNKTKYVSLGFCSTTSAGDTTKQVFGEAVKLNHSWIKWGSVSVDGYVEQKDFTINYVDGMLYPAVGTSMGYGETLNITYQYSNFNEYIIDFNNLKTTESPYTAELVDPDGIEQILIPIIPLDYVESGFEMYGKDVKEYSIEISDITVTNSFLNKENKDLAVHGYRVAEGYDDEYDKCPRRLSREMRKLGYSEIINLYIGASHFYEKFGEKGQSSMESHLNMIVDKDKTLTLAFRKWLISYLKSLKENGTNEMVMSVSMECLQMPHEWKQLFFDRETQTFKPGGTGWIPATAFYSPSNLECRAWIESISRDCLDILVESGFPPILQWGEPWYWWQEFVPEDVFTPYPNQPPCFYDEYTINKFKEDNGFDMPIFDSTVQPATDENKIVYEWLNKQLQDYSYFMRDIAKSYKDGQFTVLYFPPSIIDIERVPFMIQQVNTPFDAWNAGQLDFIQLEDYDWVTSNNHQHDSVYDFGRSVLNIEERKQHYFSGFVMWEKNAQREWELIEKAAKIAKAKGFAEVFLWAGTQIRRDNYIIDNKVTSSATNWGYMNFVSEK